MKRIFGTMALAATLLATSGSLQAANGLLIVEKTTGAGPAPTTNQIQIEANRMRAESTGANGGKQIVVFDGTRQVLMMVDDAKKTYTEITKEDAEKLGAQMSAAMAQLKQQMDAMPPEQRAQMQQMMGRMGGAAMAAPKTTYKKTGTATVGKWTCDKYEGYEGEKKTSEVCTVDTKAFGLTPADLNVTQQMAEFFKKIVPQMANQMFSVGNAEQQGYPGVPVRRTYTVGGREITSEIADVSRQSFPDASYAAPAGYAKTEFSMPGGRGRGRGGE
jgi:hypothetical protein